VATRPDEAVWLTREQEFSITEIVELSGLSEADVRELVEFGAITPARQEGAHWSFTGECLVTLRTARRLSSGLELEPHGVALVISLLQRIRELESELGRLRATRS
jgi:chaperone modulatory protein CbpM